jgi:hypothetical protein
LEEAENPANLMSREEFLQRKPWKLE